jgi:hypothetical protein
MTKILIKKSVVESVLEALEKLWLLGDHAGSIANPAIKACEEALKQEQCERNFCERCGKRVFDGIHTCTPPLSKQEQGEPRAWVGLTPEEVSDIAINNPPAVHDFYQAIADALKEKNNEM